MSDPVEALVSPFSSEPLVGRAALDRSGAAFAAFVRARAGTDVGCRWRHHY
jgi:hypothetical protein